MSVVYALVTLGFIGGVVIVAALAEARKLNKRLKGKHEGKVIPFKRPH